MGKSQSAAYSMKDMAEQLVVTVKRVQITLRMRIFARRAPPTYSDESRAGGVV